MIKDFWCDDGGGTLVEYALIICIIMIICIVAITAIGIAVEKNIEGVKGGLQ